MLIYFYKSQKNMSTDLTEQTLSPKMAHANLVTDLPGLYEDHFDIQGRKNDPTRPVEQLFARLTQGWQTNVDTIFTIIEKQTPEQHELTANEEIDFLSLALDIAETARREVSSDVYARADSIGEDAIAKGRHGRRQYLRFSERAALGGMHSSVAGSYQREAARSGDYEKATPLLSRREYLGITSQDVSRLVEESPDEFIRITADVLSPDRNEIVPLRQEVIESVVQAVIARQNADSSQMCMMLTWAWRIARHNGYVDLAHNIAGVHLGNTLLAGTMERYHPPKPTFVPAERQQQNQLAIEKAYEHRGYNLAEAKTAPQAELCVRIEPEGLWSIAMRSQGSIKAGQEGWYKNAHSPSHGGAGKTEPYAPRRRRVEQAVFGIAGIDAVADEPVIYGYYKSPGTESTESSRATDRIYGEIELVLPRDAGDVRQPMFGDTMNIVALAADEAGERYPGSETINAIVAKAAVPEASADEMAKIISDMFGHLENTEFKVNKYPYLECLIRGRVNLADCTEIRIPARLTETHGELVKAIKETYGIKITLVGAHDGSESDLLN